MTRDQVLTGRYLKVANPKRKRMITPDVMLHTQNVMIPVVRPVPFKRSFNIPLSENKPQILRTQNHRNNPALLFLETPSHTLYNPLQDLFEVKSLNCWKFKNQKTKYNISGKIGSSSVKEKNISQNSCPSKRLSRKKKSNALHFPNTVLVQFRPSRKTENLHKTSSKSIKLSRKCDLSQMKESQIRYEDKSVVSSKIETSISNIMSKSSIVSLQSQSFCDFTDTVSTVSTLSVPSLKLKENKKIFANIGNRRERSISRLASNQLLPSNSEYEINVLHYDSLLENNLPHLSQNSRKIHLKSTNTNFSSVDNINSNIKIQNVDKIPHKKSAIENPYGWDLYEIIRDVKHLREVDNRTSLFRKKEYNNEREVKNIEWYDRKPYDCKIKYSWQVIGTSTQTSYSLLQDLLNDTDVEGNKSAYKMCSIKYSWQIIGISAQASLHDDNDRDYWDGVLIIPNNKNCNKSNTQVNSDENTDSAKLQDHSVKYPEKKRKRYLILNNQQTQTFAEKKIQADTNDHYAKYSWHNLIKRYL